MDIDDLSPFLAINLLCFSLAWIIARTSGFYRQQLGLVQEGRASMVDGLRGWLALGVFFNHAISMQSYFSNGLWGGATVLLYRLSGEISVCLFFMITGFLFWGRVLRSDGKLDVHALYVSRVRRIVPMYFVSVGLALAVVMVLSGFTLNVNFYSLMRELRSWFSFGYLYAGDINGIKDAHYINAVYWTLAYEWSFYIALPMLAIFARSWRSVALFPIAFLYCLQVPVTLNFIFGALTAFLVERNFIADRLNSVLLTPLPLAALAGVFMLPSAFSLTGSALLFIFFLFVVGGNSLFGLLSCHSSRLLGATSYSIYLTHCIVLYSLMHTVNAYVLINTLVSFEYWFVASCAAAITLLLSFVTYRYVEYPFCSQKSNRSKC